VGVSITQGGIPPSDQSSRARKQTLIFKSDSSVRCFAIQAIKDLEGKNKKNWIIKVVILFIWHRERVCR
jgi:hypothetical protein